MKPACMDEKEYALWRASNSTLRSPVSSPCYDCPWSFALEMRAIDRCDGEPQTTGRPQRPVDDPKVMLRRQQIREASRRYRARKAAA